MNGLFKQCDTCGRKDWDAPLAETTCGFTQPDGDICEGTLKPMAVPKVAVMYESNFRMPAETLRRIADEITTGVYGEVGCVAIALLGKKLEVFGAGPDSGGPSVAVLLQAGADFIVKSIVNHGREE